MLDLILVIVVLGGFTIFCLGYGSFMNGFREKFGRSFIHWQDIVVVLILLFSLITKSGSTTWTVIYYISWAVLAALGIWHMVKYGFWWGLGVLLYNLLSIAIVISIINAISNLFDKNRR